MVGYLPRRIIGVHASQTIALCGGWRVDRSVVESRKRSEQESPTVRLRTPWWPQIHLSVRNNSLTIAKYVFISDQQTEYLSSAKARNFYMFVSLQLRGYSGLQNMLTFRPLHTFSHMFWWVGPKGAHSNAARYRLYISFS